MKIISSSINKAADTFLHAGYVSSGAKPIDTDQYWPNDPTLQLDIVKALELKEEIPVSGGTISKKTSAPIQANAGFGYTDVFLVTLLLCLCSAFLFTALHQYVPQIKRIPAVCFLLCCILCIPFQMSCDIQFPDNETDNSTIGSDNGTEILTKQFTDPELATKAILYGMIADGIANYRSYENITSLEDISSEIALPTTEPTPGMAYALENYCSDGWGNRFDVLKEGDAWIVTSAGGDGDFDTSDDISISVVPLDENDDFFWHNGVEDMKRWAFFIRNVEDEFVTIFHRMNIYDYIYKNKTEAENITGNYLFDLFTLDDFDDNENWKSINVKAAYEDFKESSDHEPIILQIFR